jgi:hypothetical protein
MEGILMEITTKAIKTVDRITTMALAKHVTEKVTQELATSV